MAFKQKSRDPHFIKQTTFLSYIFTNNLYLNICWQWFTFKLIAITSCHPTLYDSRQKCLLIFNKNKRRKLKICQPPKNDENNWFFNKYLIFTKTFIFTPFLKTLHWFLIQLWSKFIILCTWNGIQLRQLINHFDNIQIERVIQIISDVWIKFYQKNYLSETKIESGFLKTLMK